MAEYALLTPLTIPNGGMVPYTTTICKGNCSIRHRNGSGTVKVKGGSCCNPNKYPVRFHANVTGATGDITLGLYLDGELLPETVMSLVSGSADYVQSVDSATEICVDGCWANISARVIVGGTGGELTFNTANMIVNKEVVCNG